MVRIPPIIIAPAALTAAAMATRLPEAPANGSRAASPQRYGLTFVDNWPMPMIGVDCFVMAVPEGRADDSGCRSRSSHDPRCRLGRAGRALHGPVGAKPGATIRSTPRSRRRPNGTLPTFTRSPAAEGRGSRSSTAASMPATPILPASCCSTAISWRGNRSWPNSTGPRSPESSRPRPTTGSGSPASRRRSKLLGLRACWQLEGPAASTFCDTLEPGQGALLCRREPARRHQHELERTRCQACYGPFWELRLAAGPWSSVQFDPRLPGGGFPASMPGVIAVSDASVAGSRGNVYIAPGRGVPTTQPGGRWFIVNGSSFAAAHVSGLVALMRERRHSAPVALVSRLRGGGSVDACATMLRGGGPVIAPAGSGNLVRSGGR